MPNIPKRVLPDAAISLEMKYIYHWCRDREWNFPYVSNPFSTFWFVVGGGRLVEIGGVVHEARPGDVFAIAPNKQIRTFHSENDIGGRHFEYLALGVKLLYEGINLHQICRHPVVSRLDECAIRTMSTEWEALLTGWEQFIQQYGEGAGGGDGFERQADWLVLQGAQQSLLGALLRSIHAEGTESLRIDERVRFLVQYMRSHLNRRLTMEELSALAYTSEGHLRLLFRKHLRVSPIRYFLQLRLQKAKELLDATSFTMSEIAAETGFEDANHFSKMFRRYERISPTDYRLQLRKLH